MITDHGWSRAMNVLCVRLDTLGDVLMTTPAIRAVKETSSRRRRVTLLTSSAGVEAGRLVPEVDEVLLYDSPWMKATGKRSDSRADLRVIQELREHRFDAAVIFTVYSQNPLPAALVCFLSDIPLRLAHCRENPYQLLTNWVRDPEPDGCVRHEVRRQLDLVASVGCRTANECLSLQIPREAHRYVLAVLRELGVDASQPWAVIHAGASAPSRRYPPESFSEVARQLSQEFGWQMVFTGIQADTALVEQIQASADVPTYSLAGRLNLGQLAALLRLTPLLISNNTGPVHVAAAVGTPVVDLYALTNPQHAPWGVRSRVLSHDVPCKYCYSSLCPQGHHDCLRLVTPEQVVRAARELTGQEVASQESGVKDFPAACMALSPTPDSRLPTPECTR
jgi:lipopolysaccharide heptosyltransferase II